MKCCFICFLKLALLCVLAIWTTSVTTVCVLLCYTKGSNWQKLVFLCYFWHFEKQKCALSKTLIRTKYYIKVLVFFFWLGLKHIPLSSLNPNVVWHGQICMCLRAECELTIQTIRNFPDLNVSEKNQQWCCHCSPPLWSFCYLASFTLTSSVRLRGHMERVDTKDHKHK